MRQATLIAGLTLFLSSSLLAQTPPSMDIYTGSLGGGFALTGGNTDTRNYNLSLNVVRDPKTRNVIKLSTLYIRGSQNDVLSVAKTAATLRDEYTFSKRTFVFGQLDYLRDDFKDIRYLWAPIGGIGYKFVDAEGRKFAISGGGGGIWEKNTGVSVRGSGSLNAGQTYFQKLSTHSTFTESLGTLWKTNDFADSLTNFSLGLTTSIMSKLDLKIEFLDSFKNRPSKAALKKNDTALVTSFVVKF